MRRVAVFVSSLLLAACANGTQTPSPAPPSFAGLPITPQPGLSCANPAGGYQLARPSDWWAHPADPARGIDPCSFFGPDPFELTVDADGGVTGQTVRVRVSVGTCGVAYPYGTAFPLQEDVLVAGFPARRELVDDPFAGDYYEYVVNLTPQVSEEDCVDDGSIAILITYKDASEDFDASRRAVDQMAATIGFE